MLWFYFAMLIAFFFFLNLFYFVIYLFIYFESHLPRAMLNLNFDAWPSLFALDYQVKGSYGCQMGFLLMLQVALISVDGMICSGF